MLEKVKKTVRLKEAVREQSSDLLGKTKLSLNLEAIKEKQPNCERRSKPKEKQGYQGQTKVVWDVELKMTIVSEKSVIYPVGGKIRKVILTSTWTHRSSA